MIEGVVVQKLRLISDERGWLMEVLRRDWDVFDQFGQVYVTTAYPQVVKAWHMHKHQTDHITCLKGTIKLVLYDDRDNSPTLNKVNEIVLGERNPTLIKIPQTIWHGFKTVGAETAFVLNIPTELYKYQEPDEHRLPPDTKQIPYDWKLAPWLTHG